MTRVRRLQALQYAPPHASSATAPSFQLQSHPSLHARVCTWVCVTCVRACAEIICQWGCLLKRRHECRQGCFIPLYLRFGCCLEQEITSAGALADNACPTHLQVCRSVKAQVYLLRAPLSTAHISIDCIQNSARARSLFPIVDQATTGHLRPPNAPNERNFFF